MNKPTLLQLPYYAIGLFPIALILIIVVVLVRLRRTPDKIRDEAQIKEARKGIDESSMSYPNAQYKIFADRLYIAMKGFGTDEQKIYDVFNRMKTYSDVQALVVAFGVRDGETLSEWLNGDLSASEMAHLNAILASKSINFKF